MPEIIAVNITPVPVFQFHAWLNRKPSSMDGVKAFQLALGFFGGGDFCCCCFVP